MTAPAWNFIGDGRDVPITNMFDITGAATTDPREATSIVAMLPDGRWLACAVELHEIVPRRVN